MIKALLGLLVLALALVVLVALPLVAVAGVVAVCFYLLLIPMKLGFWLLKAGVGLGFLLLKVMALILVAGCLFLLALGAVPVVPILLVLAGLYFLLRPPRTPLPRSG